MAAAAAGALTGVACTVLLALRLLLSSEDLGVEPSRLVLVYLVIGPATGALVGLLLPLGRRQWGAWLVGAIAGAFLLTAAGAALSPLFEEGPLWFAGFGAFGGGIAGVVLGKWIKQGLSSVGR